MLAYEISLTGKHMNYSWVGDDFTNDFYEKRAELDAQGIAYTYNVKFMEYEVETIYEFYDDIEPAEIFVPEELEEFWDDDEDECDDASELQHFETLDEAKQFVINQMRDFNEFDTILAMRIILRHADTGKVLFDRSNRKELV